MVQNVEMYIITPPPSHHSAKALQKASENAELNRTSALSFFSRDISCPDTSGVRAAFTLHRLDHVTQVTSLGTNVGIEFRLVLKSGENILFYDIQ